MTVTVRATLLHYGFPKCGSLQLRHDSGLLSMGFRLSGMCLKGLSLDSGLRTCATRKFLSRRRFSEVDISGWEQLSADEPDGFLAIRNEEESEGCGRRQILMSVILLSMSAQMARAEELSQDTAPLPLEVFSDDKVGFTMLRPAGWNKVDKPGATVYFEDPQSGKNNIGVTVNPVRISSLKAFGTLDDVTEKLTAAERDKPSTKDMQVIRVQERQLLKDTPLYQLEYTLDTSRGSKRVLTAVTVSANKLYILNIIYVDGSKTPASVAIDDALHKVLDSFDLIA